MVRIRIIKISDYTLWYKNDLNKEYLMNEAEEFFFLFVKGKEFRVKKTDCEIVATNVEP